MQILCNRYSLFYLQIKTNIYIFTNFSPRAAATKTEAKLTQIGHAIQYDQLILLLNLENTE